VWVALKCVYLGALTPALALVRKPFKENLHYLEWMLADPATFLAEFTSGNLDALSISDSGEERRIELIRNAMAQTHTENGLMRHFFTNCVLTRKVESA
jgi:hypothetical protein